MNRAFIFDMDGVIVNSEPSWEIVEREFFPKMFGAAVASRMPNFVGAGLRRVLEEARSLGAVFDEAEVVQTYEEIARRVYARSPITHGVEDLTKHLDALGFKLGLVSQSPVSWMDQVVPRLVFRKLLGAVISLQDRPDLKRKPAPDGFLEAFRILNCDPKLSVILEDSDPGIAAGKASGAYTIGFSGNLIEGYKQTGADAYANTMGEVASLVATKMKT